MGAFHDQGAAQDFSAIGRVEGTTEAIMSRFDVSFCHVRSHRERSGKRDRNDSIDGRKLSRRAGMGDHGE